MSDERDILGKADALLRRHAPARAGAGEGPEVPVLTELITPVGAPPAPALPSDPSHPALRGHAPAARDDDFRRELVAEVARAVQSRLAQDLERRLTQQVMEEVRASVAATLGDLRHDIADAVTDAVTEALARRPHS